MKIVNYLTNDFTDCVVTNESPPNIPDVAIFSGNIWVWYYKNQKVYGNGFLNINWFNSWVKINKFKFKDSKNIDKNLIEEVNLKYKDKDKEH